MEHITSRINGTGMGLHTTIRIRRTPLSREDSLMLTAKSSVLQQTSSLIVMHLELHCHSQIPFLLSSYCSPLSCPVYPCPGSASFAMSPLRSSHGIPSSAKSRLVDSSLLERSYFPQADNQKDLLLLWPADLARHPHLILLSSWGTSGLLKGSTTAL